jgi:hypothetical protein
MDDVKKKYNRVYYQKVSKRFKSKKRPLMHWLSGLRKQFWSLDLNTKAIIPWWRLLHDSIGIASKLYRWNSVSFSRNHTSNLSIRNRSASFYSWMLTEERFLVLCPWKNQFGLSFSNGWSYMVWSHHFSWSGIITSLSRSLDNAGII